MKKVYKNIIIILLIIVFIYLAYKSMGKIVEGYTECTQIKNCAECAGQAAVNDTKSICFWNKEKKQCGSFLDPGYWFTCDSPPGPEPGPGPGPYIPPGPGPYIPPGPEADCQSLEDAFVKCIKNNR